MTVGDGHAIEVEGLGKCYRMYGSPLKRLGEMATLGRFRAHHEFWALRGVDFRLQPGSSLGLCGANGAGKSTLLKILAGTTWPSEGRFRIHGRVASLLELGAGFHLDFTGRANIFVNGIMMGFSKREMEAKVDEIIEFAELGAYIDEPVRTYSSGMGLRLGFAIAVAVDPDVMIIDEVFAVGDMYFQKKCVDKIYDFKQRNKTILFCSHSLYDVRQLCDEALWLRQGEPAAIGDSVTVTNEYTAYQRGHIEEMEAHVSAQFPFADSAGRSIAELPRIDDARVYRAGTDEEAYELRPGDGIELRIWWRNPDPAAMPIQLAVGFFRQDMTTVCGFGTHFSDLRLSGHGTCTVLRVPDLPLLAGQYLVVVYLMDGEGVHKYQQFLLPENIVVRVDTRDVGLVKVAHEWLLDTRHARPDAAESASEAEGAA